MFCRRAIFRGAALQNVTNVDVLALQAHGFDHLGQQFSRATYKGQPLLIFIAPRAFAHENEVGFGISIAEDELGAAAMQLAAGTIAEISLNLHQRVVPDSVPSLEHRTACSSRK